MGGGWGGGKIGSELEKKVKIRANESPVLGTFRGWK